MGIKARTHDRLLRKRDSLPARLALEGMSSVVASARSRQLCRMRLDGPRWIHSYRDGTVVTPVVMPDVPPPDVISERMRDQFCHSHLPGPGETVVDVGAGIGEGLLLFSSLVGPRGRVIAIEAHPLPFGCLQRAIELNRLSNIEPVAAAVTDAPGPVRITDQAAWFGNTIVSSDGEGTVEVEGRTLDQILDEARVDQVDLLKMNIEGAEKGAIGGMSESIARCRAVAIQCHDFRADTPTDSAFGDDAFRTKSAVRGFLERSGFEIHTRDDDPLAPVRDTLYGLRPSG
jgi:FkbM family methyltransferase